MQLHNKEEEKWVDIKGYEGIYKVSSLGRIKSIRTFKGGTIRDKIMYCPIFKRSGYKYVYFKVNGGTERYSVHNIVLSSFVPNIEKKDCINHINGVKLDNRLSNLEWIDKRGNMIHAMEVLGVKRFGEDNPNSRYTNAQVDELLKMYNEGNSVYACIKKLNFKSTTAYSIIKQVFRTQQTV